MRYISAIGFFDGVHLGHRYVLGELDRIAKNSNLSTKVVTFSHHPRSVLGQSPSENGFLLTTLQERLSLLQTQADSVLVLDFADIHSLTARQFIHYLHTQEQVDTILMGYDHSFGSDKPASFAEYKRIAADEGVELVQLCEYSAEEHVSSTVIRNLLLKGEIENANKLLGYKYKISGRVVHGRHIGRQLGFPTANISVEPAKLIPSDGVYAAEVMVENDHYMPAILNIGCNPTVEGKERTLEVHIPDYDAELYGAEISLQLISFIRPEVRFDSVDQLRKQIESDLANLSLTMQQ